MSTRTTNALLAVLLLASASLAHAAGFCALAGHYEGKYSGEDDHGFVVVDVDANTGAVSGEAQSQVNGRQVAVGGVISGDGSLSTDGTTGSGAVFGGKFFAGGAGGQWGARTADGRFIRGIWGVRRLASAEGCQ